MSILIFLFKNNSVKLNLVEFELLASSEIKEYLKTKTPIPDSDKYISFEGSMSGIISQHLMKFKS